MVAMAVNPKPPMSDEVKAVILERLDEADEAEAAELRISWRAER